MAMPFVESTGPRPTRAQRRRYIAVPALLLVVAAAGPVYYLYATSQPVIGANIGAGLGLGWTWLCGMPWSLLVPDSGPNTAAALDRLAFWYTACALLNVALAGVVSTLLYRRRRSQ